ncbi:hypothetical protein BHE74_00030326 [Ensete ventricosum]|uniref:Uncharacterized protein n=1 Tax=Ensete ventricosum TaxID=4639 RepID=A0A444FQH1_ENSVE|nr:hypothetical protein GW17_00010845 [Ensete ventricosum]RWW62535.1 hypothetical protein BHE74_00030326 [Ensete ventricosum]RZR71967.1 hypothetical protein BHM03_00009202 [Ensete ventricosum]
MRLLSLLSHAARRSGSSSWDLASTARERQRTAAAAKRFLRAKESGMSAWRKEMHNTPPQTAPQLSLRRGWKGPKCSGKDRRFMRTVFEVYLGRLSIFLYKKTTKNAYIWVACEDTACGTAGDIDGWHSLGHKAEVEPTGTGLGNNGTGEMRRHVDACFWIRTTNTAQNAYFSRHESLLGHPTRTSTIYVPVVDGGGWDHEESCQMLPAAVSSGRRIVEVLGGRQRPRRRSVAIMGSRDGDGVGQLLRPFRYRGEDGRLPVGVAPRVAARAGGPLSSLVKLRNP